MSIINQMLKDLEKRSLEKKSTHPDIVLTGLQVPHARVGNPRKIILLTTATLMLIFIWGWNATHYLLHRSSVVVLPKPLVMSQVMIAKPPALIPASPAITAITMQVHENKTFLRFVLNQEVVYQISSDLPRQLVTITLQHAHLSANSPQLDYVSSGIKDMKIVPSQDGLNIILKLDPAAQLANLELNKDGKFPELQINLVMNDVTAAEVIEPSLVPLKKAAVNTSVEQYQQAMQLVESGQIDQATALLSELLDQAPDLRDARVSLVTLLLNQGDQERARRVLAEGLQMQPFYPPFIELKARIWVSEGKIKQALHLLNRAPPEFNTNSDYYALIAALYQRVGQFSTAEQLYEQLTALHPEKGALWAGLGIALESSGKSTQAQEAYEKADNTMDLSPELRGYISSRLHR